MRTLYGFIPGSHDVLDVTEKKMVASDQGLRCRSLDGWAVQTEKRVTEAVQKKVCCNSRVMRCDTMLVDVCEMSGTTFVNERFRSLQTTRQTSGKKGQHVKLRTIEQVHNSREELFFVHPLPRCSCTTMWFM
jgi:hypothetical protein